MYSPFGSSVERSAKALNIGSESVTNEVLSLKGRRGMPPREPHSTVFVAQCDFWNKALLSLCGTEFSLDLSRASCRASWYIGSASCSGCLAVMVVFLGFPDAWLEGVLLTSSGQGKDFNAKNRRCCMTWLSMWLVLVSESPHSGQKGNVGPFGRAHRSAKRGSCFSENVPR